jgi:hypothetical protein
MVAGFLLSKCDSTVEILVKCGELEMERQADELRGDHFQWDSLCYL